MIYDNYRFKVPKEKQIRVIMNSDAKNEADDQFALVQGLLSPKFDNVGIIAAHFGTQRYRDSMERSFTEMERLLNLMSFPAAELLYRGAPHPLIDAATPIPSAGTDLIIREALKEDSRPLYLCFMGPLTDIASALLIEPGIAGRLTLIWIGGGVYPSGGPEFNLGNDVHAANVVFSSALEVWQVPKNVYEMMPVSFAELEDRVYPQGKIGRYLFDQMMETAWQEDSRKSPFRTGETWVLGDSPAIGLLLYEHRFEFDWIQAPFIGTDMQYIQTARNRPIRVYRKIDARLILEDFYGKLKLFAQKLT